MLFDYLFNIMGSNPCFNLKHDSAPPCTDILLCFLSKHFRKSPSGLLVSWCFMNKLTLFVDLRIIFLFLWVICWFDVLICLFFFHWEFLYKSYNSHFVITCKIFSAKFSRCCCHMSNRRVKSIIADHIWWMKSYC